MAQMPWPGATAGFDATKWWTDVVIAADHHFFVDALGNFVEADLEGWWDGVTIEPVEVIGYWNGTIAAFAPTP